MHPNPKTLVRFKEHFAAGYFELPDATPMRRWSRAVRRRFENRTVAAYGGTRLYPAGAWFVPGESTVVGPNHSFTWGYSEKELDGLLAKATSTEKRTLAAVRQEMRELNQALDQMRTPHTVGGRGYTHSIPNYGRVIREGLDAYGRRIRRQLRVARRLGVPAKVDVYEGLLDVLRGIKAWHGRICAMLAEARPETPEAEARRARLLAAFAQVPFRPARSFFEAMVCYNFVYYLDDCDNPGRVDQELYPFYARDLEQCLIAPGGAEGLIRELWENTDANGGWSAAIGGSDRKGGPAYNDLTLFCLRAARGMRRPNLQLHIRRDMPDAHWEEALNTLQTGTGLPALHNEEEFLRSLREAHLGVREEDLGMYNGGGCTETMIHGCSNVGSLDAGINLPLVLVGTLERALPAAADFAGLLAAFKADLRGAIRGIVEDVNRDQEAKAKWRPQPMRSLLIDDCIDNGVEYNAGGARYNWSVINIAGLANVVDSLAAVREVVYERREVAAGELRDVLCGNFEGHERLRRRLERCPRFGNDHAPTNALAHEVADFVFREFLVYAPWRGGKFLGSCLMFVTYAMAGAGVGATPDGRRAGAPLADSAGPVQGRDRRGPTAAINSLGAVPHYLAPGTLVVNMRFAREMFASRSGREKLKSLIRTYFALGGMQLQVNVIDQAVIRDAIAHPEKHAGLIVRVGGYSEYFNRLSPELKQTLLERTEHSA